jgi:nucleoside 2-deoxyribosyltransferase
MDKILGDIRMAPFVVADFTGHRNGVYLEAGFARGLGLPVIHTCRSDELDNAHFDTAQLNHVVWTTPDELRSKLFHRIAGTIGLGPQKNGDSRR